MRSCSGLIEELIKNHVEDYRFLKEKIKATDENGNRIFFLGIRNDALKLYYMGMRVVVLEIKDNQTFYSTSPSYVENDEEVAKKMSFDKMENHFQLICQSIEKYAKKEKICQQAIVNGTNWNDDNWFYIDMEYEESAATSKRNFVFGRPDMIAVSQNTDKDGKHVVALVELKVGNGSYGGGLDKTRESDYIKLKEDLYFQECRNLKLGSGIVGHIVDYMRYLNYGGYDRLKEELIETIKDYKALGLLTDSNKIFHIYKADMFADVPEIYIVSYTCVPIDGYRDEVTSLKSMKRSGGSG